MDTEIHGEGLVNLQRGFNYVDIDLNFYREGSDEIYATVHIKPSHQEEHDPLEREAGRIIGELIRRSFESQLKR